MKGQTLIELLITLSITVVIMTAITTAVVRSLNNTENSKLRNVASAYAQEGMELVRTIRGSDYTSFKTYNGMYCLDKGQTTLGNSVVSCTSPNADSIFIRSVQIEQNPGCSTNVARVTVTVAWADSKCPQSNPYCNKVPLISCLSSANPVPAL